jgi:hypothetical protein
MIRKSRNLIKIPTKILFFTVKIPKKSNEKVNRIDF